MSVARRPVLEERQDMANGRYGTFVFNGLISPPFFAPPPDVHLPHEPELEETAEVPAAREQSRAGYDIVPDHER